MNTSVDVAVVGSVQAGPAAITAAARDDDAIVVVESRRVLVGGGTQVFAHVGHPIGHAQAPALFNSELAVRGIDGVLIPFDVQDEGLESAFRTLASASNVGGALVTMPHKQRVIELCDEIGDEAAHVGAANAVVFDREGGSTCEMFDGLGLVRALTWAKIELGDTSVLVSGCGGAGSAIAFALAAGGVASLTLSNRIVKVADDLAARIARRYPDLDLQVGPAVAAGCDVAINATRLGMSPSDDLPVDLAGANECTIFDIVTGPNRSPLLQRADARGLPTIDGIAMLRGQMDAILEYWRI